jgi:hypothetical protein
LKDDGPDILAANQAQPIQPCRRRQFTAPSASTVTVIAHGANLPSATKTVKEIIIDNFNGFPIEPNPRRINFMHIIEIAYYLCETITFLNPIDPVKNFLCVWFQWLKGIPKKPARFLDDE